MTVPLRPRKIRFSSTSPAPEPTTAPELTEDAQEPTDDAHSNSESDEDEAPEAISLTKSAAESKVRSATATNAARKQAESDKKRRRDRDERLKDQRKTSKKQKVEKKPAVDSEEPSASDEEEDGPAEELVLDEQGRLPQYLPQSLLDSLPTERAPTPDSEDEGEGAGKAKKRNLHEYRGSFRLPLAKKVKDLTIGESLSVSVLEKRNELLAPKIEQRSKGIRQNWLRGRNDMAASGLRGGVKRKVRVLPKARMERRPWGKTKAF